MRRRSVLLLAGLPLPALAQATAWPSRPIRFIVPFPAGTGTPDVLGRRLADRLAVALGQPVIVENRPGAGGTIGAAAIARAAPDGYVIGICNTASHGVGPAVLREVGYHPVRDFTPIALLASAPLGLAVLADGRFADLGALLAAARSAPDSVRIGSPGNGTAAHVAIDMLARTAGARFTHVPYRGAALSVPDVLAGRIEASMAGLGEIGVHDRLRLLAIGTEARIAARPVVPTFREQGVDILASVWFGLCGPAGLPAPIADRLLAETQAMLAQPETQATLALLHSVPVGPAPRADFAAFVAAEAARWGEAVRIADVRGD
jgi:tripartite-type tricarboxylate transporter receptor subunit TctC